MAISVEARAFILVIAAGLFTMIGASVVFFPRLANLAKPNVLAIALGFAAGIMLYISLIDIFGKSVGGYEEFGHSEGDAFIYATLTFFGGCLIMLLLDALVDKMLQWDKNRAIARGDANLIQASMAEDGDALDKMREGFEERVQSERAVNTGDAMEAAMSSPVEEKPSSGGGSGDTTKKTDDDVEVGGGNGGSAGLSSNDNAFTMIDTTKGENKDKLTHMGWAMAAAIAIHNFPEGMVTYLAYTQDEGVGIALAIGIAIHNIPEGLCVSMPLYYATGKRWYAFLWGTLSGLTEPFGALLVYLVLSSGLDGNVDGILFGIVAGMMTVISVDELIPTAHNYASNPKTVTYSLLFGMLFIAASLMLFQVEW